MALNDISIYNPADDEYTLTLTVASGAVASINAGEPTKSSSAGNVVPMADGDGTTSQRFTGLAKNTSNDTASASGTVVVYIPLAGLSYAAKATTASLANTTAKIQALFYKRVKFDLISSTYTVDTADADSTSNGLLIVGGDPFTSTIYFNMMASVTILGNTTT